MEIDERLDTVLEDVYRDMQVYCVAVNAGAELRPMNFDKYESDMIVRKAEEVRSQWSLVQFRAGWAAWYAAAEDLP